MAFTPLPDELRTLLADFERRIRNLENTNPLLNAAISDDGGVTRWELGHIPAYTDPTGAVSPAQFGERLRDALGNILYDSVSLVSVGKVLATDSPGAQTVAGSGSGWTTVQTVPSSGANFTAPRSGKVLALGTLSWFWHLGVANYVAVYFAIWTQAGSLVSRKQVAAAGTTVDQNYFMQPNNVFTGLTPGAALQFRLEFALDAGTTQASFGGGATGIPPVTQVIGLGG